MSSCLGTTRYFEKTDKKTLIVRNGKALLEKLIASCNGKRNPIRAFSVKELMTATNNYGIQNVIIETAYYKFYRGFLEDRPISVMKFDGYSDAREDCFNNIVFGSQMIHKNILKLIGCCLETQIPTLVFESVEAGTLSDRIQGPYQPHFEPLLLKQRLKVAMEIANAVAYLHIGFPRTIVFRGIKPSRIFFDQDYVAKLTDFSESLSIPEGETHIKGAVVKGTIGFIAPEHLFTGELNEKCDVYSFGAVLLMLLTGQEMIPSLRETGVKFSLPGHVKKYIENNRLNDIIDPIIVEDGFCPERKQLLRAFAEVTFNCLHLIPEERPTMIDVAKQLRQMYQLVDV